MIAVFLRPASRATWAQLTPQQSCSWSETDSFPLPGKPFWLVGCCSQQNTFNRAGRTFIRIAVFKDPSPVLLSSSPLQFSASHPLPRLALVPVARHSTAFAQWISPARAVLRSAQSAVRFSDSLVLGVAVVGGGPVRGVAGSEFVGLRHVLNLGGRVLYTRSNHWDSQAHYPRVRITETDIHADRDTFTPASFDRPCQVTGHRSHHLWVGAPDAPYQQCTPRSYIPASANTTHHTPYSKLQSTGDVLLHTRS